MTLSTNPAWPAGLAVVDTLIGLPAAVQEREAPDHGIGYMFKQMPNVVRSPQSAANLLAEMDKYGIEQGLIPLMLDDELTVNAVHDHPRRLLGCVDIDPNDGMIAVRKLQEAVNDHGAVAAQFMPAKLAPPVPINDKRAYPIYAKCVELDIPVFVNGGVPGPALLMDSQYPGLVDEVAYHFPELRFVFRHGCEPWVDLTIKLLLKWPNVYYSTTGFAPRYYPAAILAFANKRGTDKILYGGYYPYALGLDRIFSELPHLPLKQEVWPKFLRDNARRVLKLDEKGK